MDLSITGTIIKVCDKQTGTSQRTGNAWVMQDYVIETEERHPMSICFTVSGEEKITKFNLQEGRSYTVFFDSHAEEYNGRYYNRITAWKVEPVGAAQQQQAAQPVTNAPAPESTPQVQGSEDNNGLPF